MGAELKSFSELYTIGKNELLSVEPTLTDFTEGAINDAYVGTSATLVQEAFRIISDRFKLTFIGLAEGTDLDYLVTDHYGPDFERPDASQAVGIVTFSRATSGAGTVSIPAGTIVKTVADANGLVKQYTTLSTVSMSGLSISASVQAVTAGLVGNAGVGELTVIESTLTDPTIVVTNAAAITGGEEILDDADYREYTYDKIKTLKGATKDAIEAAAKTVPGVEYATAVENILTVIEYDPATDTTSGDYFKMPVAKVYIADANGDSNDALEDLVLDAIELVRAAGVEIQVEGAIAVEFDWDATITLDVGGPNYATLSVDPQPIIDDMVKYIQDLPIGADFNIAAANAYILGIWGAAGTADLTDFETNTPSGNVATDPEEKLIPDEVTLS